MDYDLLAAQVAHIDIWHTTHEHVLADAPAIVEWVEGARGNGLWLSLAAQSAAGH